MRDSHLVLMDDWGMPNMERATEVKDDDWGMPGTLAAGNMFPEPMAAQTSGVAPPQSSCRKKGCRNLKPCPRSRRQRESEAATASNTEAQPAAAFHVEPYALTVLSSPTTRQRADLLGDPVTLLPSFPILPSCSAHHQWYKIIGAHVH